MENEITAHKAGKIEELPISEGGSVTAGDTIAVIMIPNDDLSADPTRRSTG